MTMRTLVCGLCLLLVSAAAPGQVALYAEYGAAKLDTPNTNWVYGPTFGAYYAINKFGFLSAGVDARGMLFGLNQSGAGATKVESGLIGPRIALRPHVVPIKPWVEGLAGVSHAEVGEGSAFTSGNYFHYAVAGGADLTFFPYLDWRVVDVTYGRMPSLVGGTRETSISTGLVVRLPLL